MSVWDEIAKDQKERKKRQGESGGGSENYSSWKEQYLAYDLGQRISSGEITAEDALNGLNSRINSWLGSAEDVAKGYNDRYFGEGVDNSAYRSDSGQYLNMLTGRKKSFDTEAENIKMYLNAYRKYMSDDYYNQILKSMESESKSFESIVNNAKKDNDHWSQWANEEEYKKYLNNYAQYKANEQAMLNTDLDAERSNIDQREKDTEEYRDMYSAVHEEIALLDKKIDAGYRLYDYTDYKGKTQSLSLEEMKNRKAFLEQLLKTESFFQDQAFRLPGGATNVGIKELSGSSVAHTLDVGTMPNQGVTPDYETDFDAARAELEQLEYGQEGFKLIAVGNPWSELYDPEFETYADAGCAGITKEDMKGVDSDYVTDKEFRVYGYYKAKDAENGTNLADEFLFSIKQGVNEKKGQAIADNLDGHFLGQLAYGGWAGLEQFGSGVAGWFADGYTPTSATQFASSEIRKDIGEDNIFKWYDFINGTWNDVTIFGNTTGQMLYDIGNTTANMLPSILTSAAVSAVATPAAGAATGALLIGASAGGNAKVEMLNMGYSEGQANAYGAMIGSSEAGLSYLLSGLPGIRGSDGAFSALGNKVISKVDNAMAKAAIALGGDMLDEGLEEGLQTVLEEWFKEIATGVDFDDPTADEVLYSSLLGMLTSAGFGGGKLAVNGVGNAVHNVANQKAIGKSFNNMLLKNGEGIGDLTASILGLDNKKATLQEGTAAYKQAQKIQSRLDKGKRVGSYSIGALAMNLSESQQISAVQSRLSAHVENKTDLSQMSRTIVDIMQGRKVSDKALAKVKANTYAFNALNDALGAKLKKGASIGDIKAAINNYQANASVSKQGGSTLNNKSHNSASFSVSENPDGGFDVVAEADGERMVMMHYETQRQAQAAAYAQTLDMGTEGTRGLVMISESLPDGANLGDTAQAFNAIYTQGRSGKAFSAVRFGETLTAEQRQYAYELGVMDRALNSSGKKTSGEVSADQDQKTVKNETDKKATPEFLDEKKTDEAQEKVDSSKNPNGEKKKGAVIYDGDRSKLSDMQKKSLDVLDKVAEALGVTFRIYESERVNGRFVYKMPDGVVKSANGWYDPKTSEIWLDINAGLNGEGTLIFTAAHELTHFIKQWSPKKFKIFADFLIEQYGERGISIDELVQRRIDKAKKNGEDIDPDVAYEEVIADSCETFLRDSNAAEKIVELNQKDASLAQKIKRFLGDMLKRLRELMRDLKPQSLEGRIVSEMTSSLQELYDLWADALADAGEAYSWADADIHSHTDGDILYSERYSYETLVNKPDMKLTTINNVVQQKPTKSMRQTAVDTALKNAKAIGKIDSTGAVSVYVDDLGNDVILSKKSLGHGLDRRFSENLPATLQAGEILKNAIRINELSPKVKTANASYVLIGAAKSPNGDLSIVEFVVNEFTNEVASIDVLKSINTKKEAAVLNAPPPTNNSLRITASSISIAQLLDFVNRYFPDILPESVWRHYGHAVRPDGELGKSALFSDRDYDAPTNREILANLLETEDMSPSEKGFLTKYKNKIAQIEANEAEISSMESELAELKKVGKKNSSRAITLEGKIENRRKEIARDERLILNLEATKPIRDLLNRERDLAYAEGMLAGQMAQGKDDAAKLRRAEEKLAYQKRKDGEALAEYKKRVAEREAEIKQKNRERLAEQREKARENLDAQAKRYQEMRERASDRRHSSEIREKIKEFKDKLQKTLKHPTDRKYIPGALAQAMIDVCELIDTDTELYKDDGTINKAQERREKTRETLARLRAEYNNIAKDADPLYKGEYDEAIAEYFDALESEFRGKSLGDMSREELERMYEILHSIDETLKNARKIIGWKEANDAYEAGDVIISEQKKIAGNRKDGKRNAVKKIYDGAGNQSLSPVRRVLEICAYDKNSPLYKLFKGFERGVREAHFFEMGAKKSFEVLTTGKNSKVYENAVYTADGGNKYTDVNGRRFGVSKMQKMQAVLSFEREAANKKTHHIEKGGLVFADIRELTKGNLKNAVDAEYSHKVTGPEAVRLIEQFKKDLEGDSWAQDYMAAARVFFNETAKNAINDVYMKLKHRILATDLAYIPFEVDQNSIVREISAEYDIQKTISSYGMLKEMQGGASNALIMTGLNNVLERHIDQVSTIHGLAIPIRDFNKVWNVKSVDGTTNVKEQIQATAGFGATKLIEQTVQDLQGERIKHFPRFYKKLKSNYIGVQFWINWSVRGKQIGSMFSATSMLKYRDPARMYANLVYTKFNHQKIAEEVDKYTATAWMRRQGLSDAELKTLSSEKAHGIQIKGKRYFVGLGQWFSNIGSKGMINTDYLVALSLWKYAKQDVAQRTGLQGEELLKATAEFYDEVIENTQSMSDVLHRPEIQRDGGIKTEIFGTFKTDLYQNAGNLRIAIGAFLQNKTAENGKQIVKTTSSIMTSAVWASMVTSLISILRYSVKRYRDEDEDEITAESWLKVQGQDLIQDLAGYIMPICGSEIVDAGRNLGSGYSIGQTLVSAIPFDAVNDLYETISSACLKMQKGGDLTEKEYVNIIRDCGNVLGIPVANILRTLKAIRLHRQDFKNGEFLSFEAGLDTPNAYRLYMAMLEGDESKIKKASRHFDNEEDISSAIRKQLREQDPRIREAAMAYNAGDLDRWDELRHEILDEGIFDKEDIEEAIKSERNSYTSKVKEAAQAKVEGKDEDYDSIVDELFEKYETVVDEDELLDEIDEAADLIKDSEGATEEEYFWYSISDVNGWFNSGDTERAMEVLDELKQIKTEASLQSSVTTYWKPKYIEAYQSGNTDEMWRIKEILEATGFYEDVRKTTKNWVKGK